MRRIFQPFGPEGLIIDRLPPKVFRRLVLAPLALALCLIVVIISPILLLMVAVADLVLPGSWRTVRVTAFLVAYLWLEAVGIVAMFGLWLASGFGLRLRSAAMQDTHYGFMRWWLRSVDGVASFLFRLRIEIEDRPKPQPGPVLVFSRHAGPGNSLMLIGTLMIGYRRRTRIVMLAKLQWEPLFDIMGNRLPNRFIRHDSSKRIVYLNAIGSLASELGERDAFVLFPEGHDFTKPLRLRAIAHLRKKGFHREADQAERMQNVLPPKLGGVMAAIGAASNADVVFVAHNVLEDVGSLRDLWGRIPLDRPIRGRYWRVPAQDVPRDQAELTRWLFDWWARIDEWIESRTPRLEPYADRSRPWLGG